ncbi:NPCBM/NEW2 domain-containing protein [Lentzea sp. NBC_00516]|uniref:NPCBM/NEW2 domain-containing protein n=1 Tax=Lentzea sp. NBC_00516 TaxID=2903582 RepID=UPI002E808DD1|nr:NPCBM/NEW2 domain-containing protein [Lentzea sp. NBC_00516]WUD21472.1 NPCBM/NEW2 domain-containing protein [Lentzea sp. NBC_00516]
MRTIALAVLSTMVSAVLVVPAAQALPDGLAPTPPMGFNNWNTTACRTEFNEAMVKGIADIFVNKGLKDAGYEYVNIDDCWAEKTRDSAGKLVPNRTRFPNGIKAVADYVHSKGLKFGIYTSAGTKTCNKDNGFPGGLDHEESDAQQFASWGVDYLKYDNCNNQGVDAKQRYRKMRDALKKTGRPIVFSLCEWGQNKPWEWASDTGHLWRTTGDINDTWPRTMDIYEKNVVLDSYAGPGHWNDPDMLEVGNGKMSAVQYRSHFSLWAIMAAPLLIGSDLRKVSADTFTILENKDVIAVDQDRLGVQGKRIRTTGKSGVDVIVKPLANGDKAVALFNKSGSTQTISTSLAEIGMSGPAVLKDLWTKTARTTTGTISASVPSLATVIYRVSKDGPRPTPPAGTTDLSAFEASSSANGWGPVEIDRSVGNQAAGDGRTITINGVVHQKGFGAHAAGTIDFYLGRKCSTLSVDVGIDDEVAAGKGSVIFQVFADDVKVADSGRLTGTDAAKKLTASLTDAENLRLVLTDAGDGINSDHGDWATPRITCA